MVANIFALLFHNRARSMAYQVVQILQQVYSHLTRITNGQKSDLNSVVLAKN